MYLNKYPKRKLLLFSGDLFLILLSLCLAYLVDFKKAAMSFDLNEGLIVTSLSSLFYLVGFYIFNLYDIKLEFKTIQNLTLIFSSFLFTALLTLASLQFFPSHLWRRIFLIDLILTFILITGWRLTYSLVFKLTIPQRNILIIGTNEMAESVEGILNPYPEYRIMTTFSEGVETGDLSGTKLNLSLENIIDEFKIDDIIVASQPVKSTKLENELVKWKMKGVNIYDMLTLYEAFLYKVPASYMKDRWLFEDLGYEALHRKIYGRLKRILDILIALAAIMMLFPLGVLISLAIKVNSKGPVFFVQERIGKNHDSFPMVKFRTMIKGAEKKGPQWAEKEDPRVTAVGKILRKMRLDEMPQFINILKGEMSVVGPRPERDFFIKELTKKLPGYSLRFSVKPGLTGWAQVHYGYAATEREGVEKWEYDLYYIKNMSLFLDIKILLKTVYIIIFGMGR